MILGKMDRQTAERLIAAALALDPVLGKIDLLISAMPDGDEKKSLINGLGDIFRVQNEAFILPISREYPDLAESG
jgi:hypothetical protein